MQDIKTLTQEELGRILAEWGEPKFHAKQIFSWIYKSGADSFDKMSNLALGLRERLKNNFYIFGSRLAQTLKSKDGTTKLLIELPDKNLIEAVLIPADKRVTGCISSQAGCKFTCGFCSSGLLGFKRDLQPSDIIEEVLYLKNHSKDYALSHIVFMGTGEPLDNYDNVIKAIRIINSPSGLNIGARRITISTCGIVPGIKRLSDEGLQVELSVSLHAADDRTRSRLMPINKAYPLAGLMAACREYINKANRQITFEYILIKGLNSSLQNAKDLSKILKGLKLCKVNLIPCNVIRELRAEPPNKLDILLFRNYLLKAGINVTLRKPRGQDIDAACGQLRLRYEKVHS